MAAAVAISSRPLWWGGVASILAAIAFFLSCLLNLAFLSGTAFKTKNPLIAFERNGTTIDATMQAKAFRKYLDLDVDLLKQLWAYRVESANLAAVTAAVTTLAFFLLLAAIFSLADAFEQHSGHRATKTLLIPAFLFATVLQVLDLTFYAGQVTTSSFIYSIWKIDDSTLKNLEISHALTNSREFWMLGMVWWFTMIGMATAAYLNGRTKMLYSSWTFLTVVIALLAFIGFLAEVGRLRWFMAAAALDIAIAILVSFFFMPIWLVWTGIYLLSRRAKDFDEVPVSGNDNGAPRAVPSAAADHDETPRAMGV